MAKKGKKRLNYFEIHPKKRKTTITPDFNEYFRWCHKCIEANKACVRSLTAVGDALRNMINLAQKMFDPEYTPTPCDQHDPGDEQPKKQPKP